MEEVPCSRGMEEARAPAVVQHAHPSPRAAQQGYKQCTGRGCSAPHAAHMHTHTHTRMHNMHTYTHTLHLHAHSSTHMYVDGRPPPGANG